MGLMIIVLGVLANLIFIVGGYVRSPKTALFCAFLGNIVYIGYYSLMGLYAPMFNVGLGALTCLIISQSDNKNLIKTLAVVNAVIITGLIVSSLSSSFDLFIVLAAWSIALAQMNKDSYIAYKIYVAVSQCFWIAYCAHFSDYAMLFTSGFIFITSTYSLVMNMYKDGLIRSLTKSTAQTVPVTVNAPITAKK